MAILTVVLRIIKDIMDIKDITAIEETVVTTRRHNAVDIKDEMGSPMLRCPIFVMTSHIYHKCT